MKSFLDALRRNRVLCAAAIALAAAVTVLCVAALMPVGKSLHAAVSPASFQTKPLPDLTPTDGERAVVSLEDSGGYPTDGENYGRLTISGTAVDCNLYYGDSESELALGAGTYRQTCVPGENGTVLIAGHTGTFFRDFESAEVGADICIETRWGEYHYEIVEMRVFNKNDSSAYDLDADSENVLLYTCYPFGQLELTDQRYMLYGRFVSGPIIGEAQP